MIPMSDTEANTINQGGRRLRFTSSLNRVICTPEMKQRLDALSEQDGAPQAYHVRKAVEEYLDRKEQE